MRQRFITILSIAIVLLLLARPSGAQWVLTGPQGGTATSFATVGTYVFVVTDRGGIFRSSDTGASWSQINSRLLDTNVQLLVGIGSTLFASTDSIGVLRSTNNGATWTTLTGLPRKYPATVFLAVGSNLYAGTSGGGLFRSSNNGDTWTAVNASLTDTNITCLLVNGSYLFAGTASHGVSRSSDGGDSWIDVSQGLNKSVSNLAARGSDLFALAGGLYHSTNNGRNWVWDTNNKDLDLIFGWRNNWPYKSSPPSDHIHAVADFGVVVLAGTSDGVFRSTDSGATWKPSNRGMYLFGLQLYQNVTLIADIGSGILARTAHALYFTSDEGTNWQRYSALDSALDSALGGNTINTSIRVGTVVFAGTDIDGVLRSTDNGITWTTLLGLTNAYPITALATVGSDVFAGTMGGGIFRSSDNGDHWIAVNHGLTTTNIYSLLGNGTRLFAGTDHGLYRTMDNGQSWIDPDTTGILSTYGNYPFLALVFSGKDIFAATHRTLYRSSDNGTSWSGFKYFYDVYDLRVTSFTVGGGNLFAVSDTVDFGIFRTTTNGDSWIPADTGIKPSYDAYCVTVIGNYLYAGSSYGVWRRPLSDFPVGPPAIVSSSITRQNDVVLFPNPTNGLLTVRGSSSNITHLTITNLLGQSLIEQSAPGAVSYTLDLSKLPAGTYFARFSIGGEIVTKKIVKE
jgi:photosystem II stability/assembly factor-like uncharacterized protein